MKLRQATLISNKQILHDLLGSNDNGEKIRIRAEHDLLDMALRFATKRVVVKRPIHSLPIGDTSPNFDIRGSTNRFDIYLIGK